MEVTPRKERTWLMENGHLVRKVYCVNKFCIETKRHAVSSSIASSGSSFPSPTFTISNCSDDKTHCLSIILAGSTQHALSARVDKVLETFACVAGAMNPPPSKAKESCGGEAVIMTMDPSIKREEHEGEDTILVKLPVNIVKRQLHLDRTNRERLAVMKMSGWLDRVSSTGKYVHRYFVLSGSCLSYYKAPTEDEGAREILDLSEATLVPPKCIRRKDGYYIEMENCAVKHSWRETTLFGRLATYCDMITSKSTLYKGEHNKAPMRSITLRINRKDLFEDWYKALLRATSSGDEAITGEITSSTLLEYNGKSIASPLSPVA